MPPITTMFLVRVESSA